MWDFVRKHAMKVAIAAFTVGLLVFFIYAVAIWPKLQPGDKGTWSGAIGTVGTLIGAIWIATSQSRQRHRDEMALATVAAASLLFRVMHFRGSLNGAIKILNIPPGSFELPDYAACARSLQTPDIWTNSDTVPLVCLGRDVAATLMMVAGSVSGLIGKIIQINEGVRCGRIVNTNELEASIVRQFRKAEHQLAVVEIELTRFLKDRGFIGD